MVNPSSPCRFNIKDTLPIVMSGKLRTFIAIDLPEHIRSTVAGVQEHLKTDVPGVNWVHPENIHLTLKFLGDVHQDDLGRIREAMAAAISDIRPFFLGPAGIGAFPGLNRPRVIWVGIHGQTDVLKTLHRRVEDDLAASGFEKEERNFAGHLTIGRVKGKINPVCLIDSIGAIKDFKTEMFTVDRIILYKSDLKPKGAVYTALFQQALTNDRQSICHHHHMPCGGNNEHIGKGTSR